ncbi:FG-GAP repeat domain-containing protein [Kocuria sp. NPDC057446]|uniref:FG-GAP repeat domain-containing protein n=1 Tax=Kocuria sp. NPDC057446 TaxID=3346137 RepID=UPI0036A00EC5
MGRRIHHLLLAATTAAALAACPAAVAPAAADQHTPADRDRAPRTHLDFGWTQGWRTDRHVRATGDVNGDGRADVVGIGDGGVHLALGTGSAELTGAGLVLRDFGVDQGWRTGLHPRRLADLDANGADDVVGFGNRGVFVSYGGPGGTLSAPRGPEATVRNFGVAQGWRTDRHLRELADLQGDGLVDVVGFGNDGIHAASGRPAGSPAAFAPSTRRLADFGWDQGWRTDRHVRQLADVTGDGVLDVVGFGDAGVQVARGRADGTFAAPALVLREFGRAQGWRVGHHPRHVADVNADGRADIVGFGHAGVWVSHGTADGTFGAPSMTLRDFGAAQGWRPDRHQREVLDLNGDGRAEIVGFGSSGTFVSYAGFDGNFLVSTRNLRDYGWHQGWRPDRHLRQLADVTGDGLPEVVGFGERGTAVTAWLSPDG